MAQPPLKETIGKRRGKLTREYKAAQRARDAERYPGLSRWQSESAQRDLDRVVANLNPSVWEREYWFGVDDATIPDREPVENEHEENIRWLNYLTNRFSFVVSGPHLEITRQPQGR